MANIGEGGDLLSNFSLNGGTVECHSSWDLTTTITGDLALTKDDAENNRQRLVMWIALPKGERINPALGCCLHDYYHEKMTGSIERRLELDVASDLKSVFPTLNIKNINVVKIADSEGSNRTIEINVSLGDDNLNFVSNWNTIMQVTEELNTLIYTGGL